MKAVPVREDIFRRFCAVQDAGVALRQACGFVFPEIKGSVNGHPGIVGNKGQRPADARQFCRIVPAACSFGALLDLLV